MGLVDYGSDSDDDSHPSPPAPTPSTLAPSSSSSAPGSRPPSRPSGLQLPPPKASNPPPAPAPAPSKKQKGPVRILLDLPPPSASTSTSTSTTAAPDSDQPAKKRAKLALGGSGAGSAGPSGAPLTGLAAMLPKPKNDYKPAASTTPRPPAAASSKGVDGLFAGDEQGAASSSGTRAGGPMFLPPSVAAKHKGKAPAAAPLKPAEPAVDFFGIGSVTSASTPSSSSSSKPSLGISSAPSISSAPPPSTPGQGQSAAAAFAQPTAADPYPGFTQLPSGEWVAKDQATYDMWVAYSAAQAQGGAAAGAGGGGAAPRDKSAREFDEGAIAEQGGLVDVDEAQRAREAWANRPSQVPGKEGKEAYKTSADIKGIPSQIGGMARRKHQLSSLLAAAHDNRAELEERIAQARANRKGAGSKYGF
ncbi:hypothetical protein JCM9279_001711 [Rhodotorula babjevae]